MKAIINGRIVTENAVIDDAVLVFDDKIREIKSGIDVSGMEVYDARGNYVIAGLVDIHIHGYRGDDVCDADSDGIKRIAKALTKNGVTSWCPTTMTVAMTDILKTLDVLRDEKANRSGARVLGANVEGPFINPKKKGAQAEEYIISPDADFTLKHKDIIKLITIAPEMENGIDFIKNVTENSDITVSIGHTDADYACAKAAIENGASHVTHLFNAMPPLTHRAPGVIGAAMDSDAVSCELIADTFHVSTALYKMLKRAKGEKLVLITDCMRAGGMTDGSYTLGGQPVTVNGIECRLNDGTIAGSILTLNKAVYNFKTHADLPIWEAVNMASLYPARVVGEDSRIGSLAIDKYADIAIVDDEMNVITTFVGGEAV